MKQMFAEKVNKRCYGNEDWVVSEIKNVREAYGYTDIKPRHSET